MCVKVFVGIVFDLPNLPKIDQKIIPRGSPEALERFQTSNQKKVLTFTQTEPCDHARGLPDSLPRVRGFDQLKLITEQETAVAAIVVDVVDVLADAVAVFFCCCCCFLTCLGSDTPKAKAWRISI